MAKIRKKLKEYLGEMGQKDKFWPKTAKFGPKTAKFGPKKIKLEKNFGHFLKDQKISSYAKNHKNLK